MDKTALYLYYQQQLRISAKKVEKLLSKGNSRTEKETAELREMSKYCLTIQSKMTDITNKMTGGSE